MTAAAEKQSPQVEQGTEQNQGRQDQGAQPASTSPGQPSPDDVKEAKADAKVAEQAYSADMSKDSNQPAGKSNDQGKSNPGNEAQKQGDPDRQNPSQGQSSSQDQPSQKNASTEDKSNEPKLDPETEKLVDQRVEARLAAELDKRIEPLLEVNRKLALFLGEQTELSIAMRQSVRAMERLLDGDARRKGKFAAMLEQVKIEGDGMGSENGDPHWINRTKGMLAQLERTGTLGPKPDQQGS